MQSEHTKTKMHVHKKDIFKIARLSDSAIKTPAPCVSDRRRSAKQEPRGQQVRVCLSSPPAVAPLAFRRPTSACSGHGITCTPRPPNSIHRRYYAQSGAALHVAPKSPNTSVRSPRICLFMSNFSCLVPETDGCCEGSGPQHLIPS